MIDQPLIVISESREPKKYLKIVSNILVRKRVLSYNFQIIYTEGNDQTGSVVTLGNYRVLIVNFRSL